MRTSPSVRRSQEYCCIIPQANRTLSARSSSMPLPDLPPVKPDLDVLVETALATGGETDRFDFKELLNLASDEHKVRLVKAIGAFGNTDDGGFVLVGISDDRRVVGLSDEIADAYDQTRVHAIVAQYLSPPARFQVRQHRYQSKRIVVIEVSSFEEVPSVVRQSANFGKEKLIAGSFLFRSKAAKSGVLEADQDVRALCETLVKRRASAFLDLVQRGSIGTQIVSTAARFTSEAELRNRADRVWPTLEKGKPSVEVGFAPVRDLQLTPEQMKTLIPAACIPVQHGFPFHQVGDKWVEKPVSWGWYGRIPMAEVDAETPEPSYLWMLSRAGAFIYREHLWEDSARSVIRGGVGLYHLLGNAILNLRFLHSVASTLSLQENTYYRVFVAANNIRGRSLQDEKRYWHSLLQQAAAEDIVSARMDVELAAVAPDELGAEYRLPGGKAGG
jgi:Putative DNA-binding domain